MVNTRYIMIYDIMDILYTRYILTYILIFNVIIIIYLVYDIIIVSYTRYILIDDIKNIFHCITALSRRYQDTTYYLYMLSITKHSVFWQHWNKYIYYLVLIVIFLLLH